MNEAAARSPQRGVGVLDERRPLHRRQGRDRQRLPLDRRQNVLEPLPAGKHDIENRVANLGRARCDGLQQLPSDLSVVLDRKLRDGGKSLLDRKLNVGDGMHRSGEARFTFGRSLDLKNLHHCPSRGRHGRIAGGRHQFQCLHCRLGDRQLGCAGKARAQTLQAVDLQRRGFELRHRDQCARKLAGIAARGNHRAQRSQQATGAGDIARASQQLVEQLAASHADGAQNCRVHPGNISPLAHQLGQGRHDALVAALTQRQGSLELNGHVAIGGKRQREVQNR